MAHALDFSGEEDSLVPPVQPDTWKRLNIDGEKLDAALKDAVKRFDTACSVLA